MDVDNRVGMPLKKHRATVITGLAFKTFSWVHPQSSLPPPSDPEGEAKRQGLFIEGEGAAHSCRPQMMAWDARCGVEGQLLHPFHLRLPLAHTLHCKKAPGDPVVE